MKYLWTKVSNEQKFPLLVDRNYKGAVKFLPDRVPKPKELIVVPCNQGGVLPWGLKVLGTHPQDSHYEIAAYTTSMTQWLLACIKYKFLTFIVVLQKISISDA